MECNEYDAYWELPGLMIQVLCKKIRNYNVEIYYNSGAKNYVLFISNSGKALYEKHFISSKEDAWEDAIIFVNKRTPVKKTSVGRRILKFLKGLK